MNHQLTINDPRLLIYQRRGSISNHQSQQEPLPLPSTEVNPEVNDQSTEQWTGRSIGDVMAQYGGVNPFVANARNHHQGVLPQPTTDVPLSRSTASRPPTGGRSSDNVLPLPSWDE